jgi:hypothetical protein
MPVRPPPPFLPLPPWRGRRPHRVVQLRGVRTRPPMPRLLDPWRVGARCGSSDLLRRSPLQYPLLLDGSSPVPTVVLPCSYAFEERGSAILHPPLSSKPFCLPHMPHLLETLPCVNSCKWKGKNAFACSVGLSLTLPFKLAVILSRENYIFCYTYSPEKSSSLRNRMVD